MMRSVLVSHLSVIGILTEAAAHNMNMNGQYTLSPTPNAKGPPFHASYADYPNGAEYFDMYSPPITSLYSEVFWTALDPVPLPPHIVERFRGKVMAVIGVECDQVRLTPDGEVPVPITASYNHHYETTITGSKSRMVAVPRSRLSPEQLASGHGHPQAGQVRMAEEIAPPAFEGVPTSQDFHAGNGGEYRKTFHGYAPGFAQLIESPDTWHHTPMQIDTWNRERMDLSSGAFVAGPLPRSSLSPGSARVPIKAAGDEAVYSGLLECPLTTRVSKVLDGAAYEATLVGDCAVDAAIASVAECAAAARSMLADDTIHVEEGESNAWPAGCSIRAEQTHAANAAHAAHQAQSASGSGSDSSSTSTRASASIRAEPARAASVFFNRNARSMATCGGRAPLLLLGRSDFLVQLEVELDAAAGEARLTLAGPSDVWFGVGFNATSMGAGGEGDLTGPYAIVVDGASGALSERRLAKHAAGTLLAPSLSIVSQTVESGVRTLVLRRPLIGASAQHFSFDPKHDVQLDLIVAVGSGPTVVSPHFPHARKGGTTLWLLPHTAAACICAVKPPPFGQARGKLVYKDPLTNSSTSVGFNNVCAKQPRMDTLAQHNPTCDLRTYAGGQLACYHGWSLLDADQPIPWADQPLEFVHKFRFWFQEYTPPTPRAPPSHLNALRTVWGLGSPVEYDVPQCAPHTPTSQCVHTITGLGRFAGAAPPAGEPPMRLIAAHFHCHAPTCLSIELFRCADQDGACMAPQLLCGEKALHGGGGRFGEDGFIAQPPCLWGHVADGFETPPNVSGATLFAVARTNSTYGHHGEMAWMQMYYVRSSFLEEQIRSEREKKVRDDAVYEHRRIAA